MSPINRPPGEPWTTSADKQRKFGEHYAKEGAENLQNLNHAPDEVPSDSADIKQAPRMSQEQSLETLQPLPSLAGFSNALPMVKTKQAVRAAGFSAESVQHLLDQFYKPQSYESLRGKNPIYLVTPSTSGANTIPDQLTMRLQQDLGGEVINAVDFAMALALTQAKDRKGYLQKMEDPSRFLIGASLAQKLAGRYVVIVDDILTSGETLDGLQIALHAAGVSVQSVVTAVAHDEGQPVANATLQAFARKLSRQMGGSSVKRILEDLRLAHGHSRTKLLQNADNDVTDHHTARRALDHIRRQAEEVRGALRQGKSRRSPGP